jgi:hypothetical protein
MPRSHQTIAGYMTHRCRWGAVGRPGSHQTVFRLDSTRMPIGSRLSARRRRCDRCPTNQRRDRRQVLADLAEEVQPGGRVAGGRWFDRLPSHVVRRRELGSPAPTSASGSTAPRLIASIGKPVPDDGPAIRAHSLWILRPGTVLGSWRERLPAMGTARTAGHRHLLSKSGGHPGTAPPPNDPTERPKLDPCAYMPLWTRTNGPTTVTGPVGPPSVKIFVVTSVPSDPIGGPFGTAQAAGSAAWGA